MKKGYFMRVEKREKTSVRQLIEKAKEFFIKNFRPDKYYENKKNEHNREQFLSILRFFIKNYQQNNDFRKKLSDENIDDIINVMRLRIKNTDATRINCDLIGEMFFATLHDQEFCMGPKYKKNKRKLIAESDFLKSIVYPNALLELLHENTFLTEEDLKETLPKIRGSFGKEYLTIINLSSGITIFENGKIVDFSNIPSELKPKPTEIEISENPDLTKSHAKVLKA